MIRGHRPDHQGRPRPAKKAAGGSGLRGRDLQTMTRDQIYAAFDQGAKTRPNPRRADCHPHRPHTAHGLCRTCYNQQYWRAGRPAWN